MAKSTVYMIVSQCKICTVLIFNVRMFVMMKLMMTMMYFYCEKEISGVLIQGWVTQEESEERIRLNKGMQHGAKLELWLRRDGDCSLYHSVRMSRMDYSYCETVQLRANGNSEVTANHMHF